MNLRLLLRPARLVATLLLAGLSARAQQPSFLFTDAPRENLDLASTPQFKLFDRAFYQNKVFLLGESHGVQRVQDVDFALLRHLNQRAGVRRYLAEVDCAARHPLISTLTEWEQLDPARFFRLNRSGLVQLSAIVKAEPYFNNRLMFSLNARRYAHQQHRPHRRLPPLARTVSAYLQNVMSRQVDAR